jgi:RNA exonuclease 4
MCLQSLVDLSGLYRVWNPKFKTWSVFSQDHLATVLLGWDVQNSSHDAVGDAIKSIRLYNLYNTLQADAAGWQKAQARASAHGSSTNFLPAAECQTL